MINKPFSPKRLAQLFMILGVLLLFASSSQAATVCKTLSKSQCERNSDCSWVSGYKTKKGTSVKSYCRSKTGKSKGSSAANKKSSRQDTDDKNSRTKDKKKASKSKKKDKTDTGKSVVKKKSSDKKTTKKNASKKEKVPN